MSLVTSCIICLSRIYILSDCRLLSDLLQRLRTRERERRLHQRSQSASREGRKSLSYDAAPFYITPPPATSSIPSSQETVPSDTGSVATSTDMTTGASSTDLAQRRQLGERLYPKVQSVQPVSYLIASCFIGHQAR